MRMAHYRRSQTIRRAKEIFVKMSKLARPGLRWAALALGVLPLTVLSNQTHFDGSKADGLTIEIVGMGPATSTQIEAK